MSTPTALSNRLLYARRRFMHTVNPFRLPPFPAPTKQSQPTGSDTRKSQRAKISSPMCEAPPWRPALRELLSRVDTSFHPYCGGFEDYVQLLIPMATRTSLPTGFDNFTGPVLLRLPLFQYTQRKTKDLIARDTPLHIRKLMVALKHLQAVKSEIDYIKKYDAGPIFFLLTCLSAKVFPDCITKWVVTDMNNRMQLVLTNVKGPENESTIGNRKVHSLQFWPPAKGEVTGGISILSYRDKLQIFSIFDEAEFLQIFNADELKDLTRRDFAALSQFVSNLIKTEFLRLHDLIQVGEADTHGHSKGTRA
eukprot:Gregarina_sp_Poly_1__5421@NODE_2865_length_1615_cov_4_207364_g1808_i0_p1_GENE_NODE_2865_length_1615_cov_4_207364_g1808_i0NODE_2865_length_1615_cov_4_207364_g1808_i0_p1_ORF_typecomplete_len333_score30_20DUF1298/PF06974_13/3_8e16_NODE_2865_length_1615_cov_4_207364_g1808_i0811001